MGYVNFTISSKEIVSIIFTHLGYYNYELSRKINENNNIAVAKDNGIIFALYCISNKSPVI